MAGAKGRSGGARPGAGRPKGSKTTITPERAAARKIREEQKAQRRQAVEARRRDQVSKIEQRKSASSLVCCCCKNELPVDSFYRHATKGYRYRCKACANQSAVEWQKRNPERYRILTRSWREGNRDHRRMYAKTYAKEHPEKLRSWRESSRETRRKYDEFHRGQLTDGYLRRILSDPELGVRTADVPQELVEAKRAQLIMRRKLDVEYRPISRDRVCQNCGQPYRKKASPSKKDGDKYCSRDCAFADLRAWHPSVGKFTRDAAIARPCSSIHPVHIDIQKET